MESHNAEVEPWSKNNKKESVIHLTWESPLIVITLSEKTNTLDQVSTSNQQNNNDNVTDMLVAK